MLGAELGIARVVGSIGFAVIIGIVMAALFRRDESAREAAAMQLPEPPPARRRGWQNAAFLGVMILFLVFSDWARPSQTTIARTDGTQLQVAVLLETTDMLRVQVEQPVGELAGPALSLPSIAVIYSVIGLRKTATFVALTVGMSAAAGMVFGWCCS